MPVRIIFIIFAVLVPSLLFADDIVLNGDIDGDGRNEKIVLENYKQRDMTFKLKIFKRNKLVFSYDKFENKSLDSARIINFKIRGTDKHRDVLFIIVADCDAALHIVSYEKTADEEGGPQKTGYVVKKHVAVLQTCK